MRAEKWEDAGCIGAPFGCMHSRLRCARTELEMVLIGWIDWFDFIWLIDWLMIYWCKTDRVCWKYVFRVVFLWFSVLFVPWSTLGAHVWGLWVDLGAHGLTFEGLGLTLEAHGITLGAFELQFSSPWGHLGVILAAIGSILGSLGCSKSSKMHQECWAADIANTWKKHMFFDGFEGWRHPS